MFTIYDTSGKVLGTITYNYIDYSYTFYLDSNWAHQIQIQPIAWTGLGATGGYSVSGRGTCSGACKVQSVKFSAQKVVLNKFINGETYYQSTATAAGAVGQGTTTVYYHFSSPTLGNSTEGSITQIPARCDNAVPGNIGAGCVFAEYEPAMIYQQSGPFPQLANHIAAAQASGLPGAYGSGTSLTRSTDQTKIAANGAKACGNPPKLLPPAGYTCDEYPFRSTYQGASTGGGSARAESGCYMLLLPSTGPIGYSICMIDGTQNSQGGSALGSFYLSNRLIDRDAFTVWIQP